MTNSDKWSVNGLLVSVKLYVKIIHFLHLKKKKHTHIWRLDKSSCFFLLITRSSRSIRINVHKIWLFYQYRPFASIHITWLLDLNKIIIICACRNVLDHRHATLCRFDDLSCWFCCELCDAFEVHLLKSRDFLFFSLIIFYGSMRLSQDKRLTDRADILHDGKVYKFVMQFLYTMIVYYFYICAVRFRYIIQMPLGMST